MNNYKRFLKELNILLSKINFSKSEIISIQCYSPEQQLFILMFSTIIPFSIRCECVSLYKKYINPSCTIPKDLVRHYVSPNRLSCEVYSDTMRDIRKSGLIIY